MALSKFPETLIDGQYKYKLFCAEGGQGAVCIYEDIIENTLAAVKFDPTNTRYVPGFVSSVLKECEYLRKYSE
jgi:hypothetical protein